MDFLICLVFFIAAMLLSLAFDISLLFPLLLGYFGFLLVGIHRNISLKSLLVNSTRGVKEAFPAILIFMLVGIITAAWRTSGTIAFFLYYGLKLLHPYAFVLMSFLLCCILSYALGTTFGVAGTLGVVLMIICRTGNINEAIVAGAILSGIYFGDRCSPFSSCTNLIALSTNVAINDHVRQMLRTSIFPVLVCVIIYTILSIQNPITLHNDAILHTLKESFDLSFITILPVALIFILPLLKVPLKLSMGLSILAAGIIALVLQGTSLMQLFYSCIFGVQLSSEGLGAILNGGGMISMLTPCYIAMISNMYPAMFEGTTALDFLYEALQKSVKRMGRFMTTSSFGVLIASIFCNQSLALMMEGNMLAPVYKESGADPKELAADIGNSTAMLSGLIPWCIACSVPLNLLDVGIEALPFAFLLYASPVCYRIKFKRNGTIAKNSRKDNSGASL